MNIKDEYTVTPIPFSEAKEWCLYKHYAKRIPPISFAFGLYDKESVLQGICTYGHPLSCTLKGVFGDEYGDKLLELNRLCVNDGLPKNVLSFFVGQTFKMLPTPTPLVSYADSGMNHHGYIYQATNWIYTGLSAKFEDYVVKGMENLHPSTIGDRGGAFRQDQQRPNFPRPTIAGNVRRRKRLFERTKPQTQVFLFLGRQTPNKANEKITTLSNNAVSERRQRAIRCKL